MTALLAAQKIQRLLDVEPDGDIGPKTMDALNRLGRIALLKPDAPWPRKLLVGTSGWKFSADIVGADIVLRDVRATCFGGSDDPQDSGETASGISTKDNPKLCACSLPMDGRMFPKMTKAEHAALDGSPIPRVPWKTIVRVTRGKQTVELPVIDLGPAKRTGNALDLTVAAARLFDPKATAQSFEMRCDMRILGGAAHVPA